MIRLLYASTGDKDLLYALNFPVVHDPAFFLDLGAKKHLFLDRRELGVFEAINDNSSIEVLPLEPLLEQARASSDDTSAVNKVGQLIIEQYKLLDQEVAIADSLPVSLVDWLRTRGATLVPTASLYPERHIKSPEEVEHIRAAHVKVQVAFRKIEAILRASDIDGEYLRYREELLTSERIKQEVELLLLADNLVFDEGLIVSSGAQAAMPHHEGEGPLLANQTIICDLFPRDRTTNYYADMTRTYVKGTPSPRIEKMYDAVLRAQEEALASVRAGVSPETVHQAATATFEARGFEVASDVGFIHGTGHGLGLDVHERPSLRAGEDEPLVAGNVVTIEPGLYYPKEGGVRIEDVIVVTADGYENLTQYEKQLVIH